MCGRPFAAQRENLAVCPSDDFSSVTRDNEDLLSPQISMSILVGFSQIAEVGITAMFGRDTRDYVLRCFRQLNDALSAPAFVMRSRAGVVCSFM